MFLEKAMKTGTVKWFNPEKGYGFITPDFTGDSIVAYGTEVESADGTQVLYEHQRVSYDVGHNLRGPFAQHIRPLGEEREAQQRWDDPEGQSEQWGEPDTNIRLECPQ